MRNLESREKKIEAFFNRISKRYDLLNHLLSFGVDILWRKRLADTVEVGPVLDLATGTGDVARCLKRKGFDVVGLDISMPMLKIAKKKLSFPLVRGSALFLPFKSGSFGWVTVAFGLRNFPDPLLSLKEMRRVLKENGGVSILEFTLPENILRYPYLFYFKKILPLIGSLLSDGEVYRYLPESVMSFPKGRELVEVIENTGFRSVRYYSLSMGIVGLYVGRV